VPLLKVGDLVTMNKKGNLYFENKSLAPSHRKIANDELCGVVLEANKDSPYRSKQGDRAVTVAWCMYPPFTSTIRNKWLKKVYFH